MSTLTSSLVFSRTRGALSPIRTSLVGLVFSLGAAACTSGQTGGEIDVDNEGGLNSDGCEVVEETPIGVDESDALGFSAQDVIDAIKGVHETTLSWGEAISQSGVTITPQAGETSLTVEVRPKASTATLAERKVKVSNDGNLAGEIGGATCLDEIRIEAEVTVTSGNGALSDTFDVVFRSSSENVIHGSVEVTPGQLSGSFDVEMGSSAEPVQTALQLSFAFGTLSGELSGLSQQVHGDAVSASTIVYGRFPLEGCDYGTLIGAESPWGEAIHNAVEAATEFDFSWSTGEETGLFVEPGVGKLCLEGTGDSTRVVGAASARVTTEDGRIDGDWDLELSATVTDGDVATVLVRYPGTYTQGFSAQEFEATTGISGFETDASDLGFQFDYSVDASGEEPAQGSFAIVELIVPDCARPGHEPEIVDEPGGGSSSPGCEGIDLTEIETASFRQVVE